MRTPLERPPQRPPSSWRCPCWWVPLLPASPRPSAGAFETSTSSLPEGGVMDSAHKLNELFDQTEKLLAKLADERGPDIQALRERLIRSMTRTREALKESHLSNEKDSSSEHVKV